MSLRKFLLLPFCCCLIVFVSAQTITITGKVTDKQTEEPLPFANIFVKGNPTLGTTSDYEGNFTITLDKVYDSLGASTLGYVTFFKPIAKPIPSLSILFQLERSDFMLQEVVILPGENPANILMRKVIANRNRYNKNRLDSYAYEVYNKMEIDLDELNDKFKDRKIFKPFKFVFNNIDSVSEEKPFLPFFMSEVASEYHYRKNPLDKREIIKGSKISGVNNVSISQLLGNMYVNFDIYEEWINLMNRQFISPISSIGLATYRYYIVDSAEIDKTKCYKLQFMPRRKGELTFEGDMWIADSAFALKQISMKMSKDADVNFVRKIFLYNEFENVKDSVWMLRKERMVVNFIKPKNSPGLIGRKTTSYRNFQINESKQTIDSLFKKIRSDVTVLDSADQHSNSYWNQLRHDTLSKNESKIYTMIDTLRSLPIVKTYIDVIQTLYTGYKDIGPISIGNYWTFVNLNDVEGWRFKFGLSTSNKFSKYVLLNAYAAYGLKDRKVKYGGSLLWLIKKSPRQSIGASYKNDVINTSDFDKFYASGGLLSSIGIRRVEAGGYIPQKIIGVKELKVDYFREFNMGYSFRVGYTQRYLQPLGNFVINFYSDSKSLRPNKTLQSFTSSEFSIFHRFSWQEKFVSGEFDRLSLGSKYPELYLQYTLGIKRLANSDFNYHKISFGISDVQPCGPLGRMYWRIEVGKTIGTLPFIMLNVANTSESYIYNWSGFNLLRQYEFAADRYVNVLINHHFGGILFNRIPGVRKLKWREAFTMRMFWGDMTAANKNANYFNSIENINSVSSVHYRVADKVPYIELGAGIENIFKIFRVDAFWRATHTDSRGSAFSFKYGNFGVRLGIQLQF